MPELISRPQKGKGGRKVSTHVKIGVVLVAILAVVIFAAALYIRVLSASISTTGALPYGLARLNVSVSGDGIVSYDNSTQLLPYLRLNYGASNIISINATLNFYTTPPATTGIYVLNWSGQCYPTCANISKVVTSLTSNLIAFGLLNKTGSVKIIEEQNLTRIPNGATVIILNGLLPDYLLAGNAYNNLLTRLFEHGMTVVYVGGSFSNLISSGSIVVPANYTPTYLDYSPSSYAGNFNTSGYYLTTPLFSLAGESAQYRTLYASIPVTFEPSMQGAFVALPNYINKWPSPYNVGYDIAKILFYEPWLNAYRTGNATITIPRPYRGTGNTIIFANPVQPLNDTPAGMQATTRLLNNTYARLAITALSPTGNYLYKSLYFSPNLSLSGSLSFPPTISPTEEFNATMSIFVNNATTVEPHLEIFNQNMTLAASLAPFFTKQITPPRYTFIHELSFKLPAGSYFAQLTGFSGQDYGAAYFTVPPVSVGITNYNLNTSTFYLYLTSDQVPLNNMNATVYMNGEFNKTVFVRNGTAMYNLSSGQTLPSRTMLNFTVSVLGENTPYTLVSSIPTVQVNKQYIEFILTLLIVLVEVTIIKAPARDDFYVDVSSMPRPSPQTIRIKNTEFLSVFEKLNTYYHWRYMPLSKEEFRIGVSGNIHYNAMPVMLTFKNMDIILDQMVGGGYLATADGMYAPKAWVEQSKHDIDYLVTFKKLRIYLVSHGHMFTDLDKSDSADIVTTLHNEKAYIVIYSPTSKFKKIPIYSNAKTYLAFINSDACEAFKSRIYKSTSAEAEMLKLYISVESLVLMDADNPDVILT